MASTSIHAQVFIHHDTPVMAKVDAVADGDGNHPTSLHIANLAVFFFGTDEQAAAQLWQIEDACRAARETLAEAQHAASLQEAIAELAAENARDGIDDTLYRRDMRDAGRGAQVA